MLSPPCIPPDGADRPAAPERAASPGRDLDLLEEMGAAILEAATILSTALNGTRPVDDAWQAIRDLEHKGDAVARDVFEMLVRPQPVSLNPESLKALTGYLDDILDAVEAAAARLAIHRVRRAIPQAREMGRVVLESAQELRRALFRGRRNPKDIIKWKDVLETLVVQAGVEERLRAGQIFMSVERHEITVGGRPVGLSAKEFALLHLLLRHQGKVVRRERLLHGVWGEDYYGDTRTLDTHVGWLRRKLEAPGGIRIVAVRGLGYRLDLRE